MIDQWIRERYSHIHIGVVRLIPSLHGRKSLPGTARVALLNTIYKQYEHAVIGTYLTTLHAGGISLTYDPNFNIPFRDQNLHNCLKDDIPIHSFQADGTPVYIDKINGHVIWDIDPNMCDADCDYRKCLKSLDAVLRDMFTNLQFRIAKLDVDLHRKDIQSSSESDTAYLSPFESVTYLTQIFMAYRTNPQPSTQTYGPPDESSSSSTPIIKEPPEGSIPGQPNVTRPTNGLWFNLDDSPSGQWRKKIYEMNAWLDLQIAKSEHPLVNILREFVSRFTGSLKDRYQHLGEYRPLQFVRSPSVSLAMGVIFKEFLGDVDQFYKQSR
ncbi:hypothetical protein Ddye_009524 [Dipteronia dyeriana]|uniref:Uncharacterized protein n=1 Tax=Dipteronia dyeriana TaxID=168575 RepID=A0AAE0CMB9_9ROSI|nr:hypothetical protein Ddye_009524 [Dipteronia dyeriana]